MAEGGRAEGDGALSNKNLYVYIFGFDKYE